MKKNAARSVILIACILMTALSWAWGFDFTKLEKQVHEKTLANGLTIIVMERHDAPVVSFVTWANVGGANDPKEYTGLAHMFEHMAFKGTDKIGSKDIVREKKLIAAEDSIYMELLGERRKGRLADSSRIAELEDKFDQAREASYELVIPNEYSQIIEREGGVGLNAGTSMDFTVYFSSYPSNKVELWMAMESDRFSHTVFREMYKERDVIMEERRQSLESSPFGRLVDELTSAAFKAHPYGVPIIGHASDIRNYTRAAAKAYYNKYYVPSNMVVAVVGDVKPSNIFELAEKYWGQIPYKPKPPELATVEPEQKGERRVILEDPAQPLFFAGFHIPESTSPEYPAVTALADYYGQGRTSLLYKKLVKEKKIAAQVGVYPGYPADKYPSLMLIYVIPTPGSSLEEIESDVFAELDKLKTEPIPDSEIEKIKARAKSDFIFGLDSNLGMAMQLASYQTTYDDWREMFKELDRINAVTAEDVQNVAQKYFDKTNRTVAVMKTVEN
jgi:predicted Zn-dependent peptidase